MSALPFNIVRDAQFGPSRMRPDNDDPQPVTIPNVCQDRKLPGWKAAPNSEGPYRPWR